MKMKSVSLCNAARAVGERETIFCCHISWYRLRLVSYTVGSPTGA